MGMSEMGVGLVLLLSLSAMVWHGYKKGLLKKIFAMTSLLLSIAMAKLLMPVAQQELAKNEELQKLVQNIAGFFFPIQREGAQLSDVIGSNPTPDKSMENIDLFYQFIGLEQWKANLSEKIFQLVYSVIFFVILYLILRILLKIGFQILEYLFKLPGLNLVNRISGAALSAVEWVFWLWFALILLSILPNFPLKDTILEGFSRTGSIPYILKESNLFTRIFFMN